jgi:hypothetical protein
VFTGLEFGGCPVQSGHDAVCNGCPREARCRSTVAGGQQVTALCSEGGEWIWLGGSQSRPGQSKRISAIVRLEELRREPSLRRRSVASLSNRDCAPGCMLPCPWHRHGRCRWPSIRTGTSAPHRVPTSAAVARRGRRNLYPARPRHQQHVPGSHPNRALHVGSLRILGRSPRIPRWSPKACSRPALAPSAVSNHPPRPHVFTLHDPRLQPKPRRCCNSSVASCSRPRLLPSIRNKRPQASLEPPPGPIC